MKEKIKNRNSWNGSPRAEFEKEKKKLYALQQEEFSKYFCVIYDTHTAALAVLFSLKCPE